ncbi:MAG: hypothetical protein HY832_00495 [Candidatus Aenigmarchaeota archaeon]|nr:hypothetical protein [Candidatus Aenigmarchaeota archaeon]
MIHLPVVVLGNIPIAEQLGKKGTESDIVLYNHTSSEGVFTYITIHSEKIQPLLEAVHMADVCVIAIKELTKPIGEQIVLAAARTWSKGFFFIQNIPDTDVKALVKGTSLASFEFVSDIAALRQKIASIPAEHGEKPVWIPIDTTFNVKSVGTIILGIVQQGTIRKHDTVRVEPLGKEVSIKSIQSQDHDIDEASTGTRVGLNLKGVEADELRRGFVLCAQGNVAKELTVSFTQSLFYNLPVEPQEKVFFNVGLQVVSANYFKSENKVVLDVPVVFHSGDEYLIVSQRSIMPRLIGNGTIQK